MVHPNYIYIENIEISRNQCSLMGKEKNTWKVITDEKAEPIEKQIQKSNIKPAKVEDDISELARDNDEFVDLESIKIAKDSELVTMLVFDDVDSIVGVDERVYGPFRPQDLVVLPKINAKIFVKNHKARFVKI